MSEQEIHVVKVGGSLLTTPNVGSFVWQFCEELRPARVMMIVGGGGLIDAVRRLDAIEHLEPTKNHWRCVDLLDATFAIAAEWFDFVIPVTDLQTLQDPPQNSADPLLVKVSCFYDSSNHFGLPQDWTTTTDAIAIALASEVGAAGVTLLKSCAVPPVSLDRLSQNGIVDTATPAAARRFDVSVKVKQLSGRADKA